MPGHLVESVAADVGGDLASGEVRHVDPGSCLPTNLGRGDGQSVEGVDEKSVSALVPVAADVEIITTLSASSKGRCHTTGRQGKPGASGDDDVGQLEQALRFVPCVYLLVRVDPDNQKNLAVRVLARDLQQRVDRIRRTRASNLDVRWMKYCLRSRREPEHLPPVVDRRGLVARFVGRSSRQHQQYGRQVERACHLCGAREVPEVHRVEGSAENADAIARLRGVSGDRVQRTCPTPRTTYL